MQRESSAQSFMQILSPRYETYVVWVGQEKGEGERRRWQEDWPEALGERTVSFLICSHERINAS